MHPAVLLWPAIATPTFTVAERRARLAVRHQLAPARAATTAVDVARGVVALHATDPGSVFLGVAARTNRLTAADIERELYDERALVRMLGMRRTMFVVAAEDVPLVHASSTAAVAARERRRTVAFLTEAGVAKDVPRWLRKVEADTLAAIDTLGEATGAELSRHVAGLRTKLLLSPGKKYESRQNITTRVLTLLAADGKLVRSRPRGTWVSSQYRWAAMPPFPRLPTADAQATLVRRYLGAFGPARITDVKWWTGWNLGEVKRALSAIDVVEVDVHGGAGVALADDLARTTAPKPWAALLPALDTTVMGWGARDWYLGDHARSLFDTMGNAGPTVWWNGRVVGGWAQRTDGEIAMRLLDDVGRDARAAIDRAAQRVHDFFADVRLTPRFPTPLATALGR